MRKSTRSHHKASEPSLRGFGAAQERPDPALEPLFRWLERQPRRTPDQQVDLARAYQADRRALWAALLGRSADALALIEDEVERAEPEDLPEDLPGPGNPGRLGALVDFARGRDVNFALSRDFRPAADAEFRAAEAARKRLCESNLRLVITVAKRYRAPADPLVTLAATLPFADLIQEGTVGLLRACDLFDPELGWRFSTYACWWIRHAINRAIAEQSRVVRVPAHVADLIGKAGRAEGAFLARHGRLPTDDELAAALRVTARRAALVRGATASSRVLTLDPPGEGDDDQGGDGADEGRGPGASEVGGTWAEAEAALLRDLDGDGEEDPSVAAAAASADALDALAPRAKARAVIASEPRAGRPRGCRPTLARLDPAEIGPARAADRARMRAAVELRWGLLRPNLPPLTYDEVGAALGVGRELARKTCAAGEHFVAGWAAAARAAEARDA